MESRGHWRSEQGTDMWLGYDLERATVLKAWQAPAGKPGLIKSGFVTRSTRVRAALRMRQIPRGNCDAARKPCL